MSGNPGQWRNLALPGLYEVTARAVARYKVRIDSDLLADFDANRLIMRIKCGGRVEETAFHSLDAIKADLVPRARRIIERLVDQHDNAMRAEYGM